MGTGQSTEAADALKHMLDRYQERIQYYSKASQHNKRAYKTARYLAVVLGALVTLLASLSSAYFIRGTWLETGFDILTPLLAAGLAIVGGFSQNFQWGAAWSDMRIVAERLETELDRISATPPDQIDAVQELALLDAMVLDETRGFFQRLFGKELWPRMNTDEHG
jgi:AcrR family transcriptional regulator